MRPRIVTLTCVVAAVALGACGGDDEPAATTAAGVPGATTTAATTPAATPPPAAETTTTPPTATTGVPVDKQKIRTVTTDGESGEGGAGDEEPARVPVALTHTPGRLSPTTVTVPAFLTLQIAITGPAGVATLPGGKTLTIPGTTTIPGLKPAKYTISTSDGGKTTLDVVNGGDPGP